MIVSAQALRVGEYAKLLSEETGIKIGPNRLFDYLRDRNYLMTGRDRREKNKPKQTAIEEGLFTFKYESAWHGGKVCVSYVTGKGQVELREGIVEYFESLRLL